LLAILATLFLLSVYASLNWRMEQDTPLMHYVAFLMDKHVLVPYRDIFETSMPGVFVFHYLIVKLFGYGDVPFRYVDLVLLSALLVATYAFMSRFGRLVAVFAAILFGLFYLSAGQQMSLQRDYLGVIPVAFALLCIPTKMDTPVQFVRFTLIGLLFGMSILIKPHLVIALPIVFGTLLAFRWHIQKKTTLDFFKCALITGASLLLPVSIALVWLSANSALAPFIDISFNYLPLHTSLTGGHRTISGLARVSYLIGGAATLGGLGAFFLSSLFAYYYVLAHTDKNKASQITLRCLFLCTLAYAFYPALAGKFWPYHYMPFAYFCSISMGLCLFASPHLSKAHFADVTKRALLLLILVIAVTVQLPIYNFVFSLVADLRSEGNVHSPKNGRVDEISGWLKERLHPGDSVQPLDWTGGSIHGMLLAEAKLATHFMYDYHFYHHVSSPYIQELRHSFIRQLHKASPRFIVEVYARDKPWVSGIDTTREFPELSQYLYYCYSVAHEGNGYRIYERTANCGL
jgi:hypothetical protein